jgi:lipopolysaccharide/colanic/teichoic acid biosynthesis glycosyltransferase
MATPATLTERILVSEGRYFVAKRVLDVLLALTLLVVLSPVMAIVAALIALDSPGPVLFRQRRVGQNGVPFDMLKFRSMYHKSDATVHVLAVQRYMQGERLSESETSTYKLTDDKRITRAGKFIRKTSLDELPQLWNVVMGEMSLVGPRPPVPYEVDLYTPREMLRLEGKPGLTGPWQVYGRNTVTFKEMIEMDIHYLENRSIWYDLKLIVLTVPAALRGG